MRDDVAKTISFKKGEVKKYIDKCIKLWRIKRGEQKEIPELSDQEMAIFYIDAFQSIRASIFGKTLS